MNTKLYEITCSSCDSKWHVKCETIIHAQNESKAKKALLSQSFFTRKCSHCGTLITFYYPFLYCDPKNKLLVALCSEKKDWIIALEKVEMYASYTKRIVVDELQLKEKIAIYDFQFEDKGISILKKRLSEQYEWIYFDSYEQDILWFSTDLGMIGIQKHYYQQETRDYNEFIEVV